MRHLRTMFLLLMLGFALGIPVAVAQAPPATMPPSTVYGRLGAGQSGPGQAIPLPVLSANLGGGGASLQQHPISGASTVASTDCGTLIVASGNALYAIAGIGTFPLNCTIRIFNADPMPTGSNSTGAKFVNFVNCIPGETGTYLWPQQSMEVTYISGAWVPTRCPGLWEAPAGIFVINISPPSGSDTWGTADGLSTGARAFATFDEANAVVTELMQGNYLGATQFTYTFCSSCTNSGDTHIPPHGSPVNSQGLAGVVLNCNGGTVSGTLSLFLAATLQVENCTFTNTISVAYGATFTFSIGNTITPVSGQAILNCSSQSKILTQGNSLNVAGGTGGNLIQMSACSATLPAINQLGNITWTDATVRVQAAGYLSPFGTWTTNSFSTTGTAYKLAECGIVEGSTNIPGSTGSASCTQAN